MDELIKRRDAEKALTVLGAQLSERQHRTVAKCICAIKDVPAVEGLEVGRNIDETIIAFRCCVQIPSDCANCPQQGPGFGIACKQALKDSVLYWLNVVKDRMHAPEPLGSDDHD